MRLNSVLCRISLLVVTYAAQGESIAAFTDHVGAASATQLTHVAASYNPQDWAGDETYPGVDSTSIGHTYHYKTYTFAAADFAGAPYVEITDFDQQNSYNLYFSAYSDRYDPTSPATNWLGDEGLFFNYPYNSPNQFEVVLPSASSLVLVVNTTDAENNGDGVDSPYKVTVDAYADASYTEPVVTPEPSSFLLLGSGVLGILARVQRRSRSSGGRCVS